MGCLDKKSGSCVRGRRVVVSGEGRGRVSCLLRDLGREFVVSGLAAFFSFVVVFSQGL